MFVLKIKKTMKVLFFLPFLLVERTKWKLYFIIGDLGFTNIFSVMLHVLYEDITKGGFECVFIACLNITVYLQLCYNLCT